MISNKVARKLNILISTGRSDEAVDMVNEMTARYRGTDRYQIVKNLGSSRPCVMEIDGSSKEFDTRKAAVEHFVSISKVKKHQKLNGTITYLDGLPPQYEIKTGLRGGLLITKIPHKD